jgi:hypothetical protein
MRDLFHFYTNDLIYNIRCQIRAKRVLVTMAKHILRMQMIETAPRYGG